MNAEYSQEIEELYLGMYNQLFTYSRCAFENTALAEEAVQETFLIACSKPEALCNSPNPEGWLVITMKNVIANTKRNRASASRIVTAYEAVYAKDLTISENNLDFSNLYEDVAALKAYKLLREMVIEEKSHLEMAQELGISVSACKKRVQRAKEILKKKILL